VAREEEQKRGGGRGRERGRRSGMAMDVDVDCQRRRRRRRRGKNESKCDIVEIEGLLASSIKAHGTVAVDIFFPAEEKNREKRSGARAENAQRNSKLAAQPKVHHRRQQCLSLVERLLTTVSPPSFALENEGVLSLCRRDILGGSRASRRERTRRRASRRERTRRRARRRERTRRSKRRRRFVNV